MIAVDTNVLLRLITRDDEAQTAIAEDFLEHHGIHILPAVLMETEWVLRSRFRWPRAKINAVLTALLRTEGVTASHPDRLHWALSRHAAGADLADMLHLAQAQNTDGFATFDQGVADSAGNSPPVPVMVLG